MPIFQLTSDIVFPPVELASEEGILAISGDLCCDRILLAYESGIFPWFSENEPIVWWAPDPRFILFPHKLKVSKSMRPVLNSKQLSVTYDQAFKEVIKKCKSVGRKDQDGTWITSDIEKAYTALHKLGYAHSVEVWRNEKLVAGLYGVSLGRCFFGESMFSEESNASKYGFINLVRHLRNHDFNLIDCQVYTDHLASLGAEEMPRTLFSDYLKRNSADETLKGNWNEYFNK